MPQFKRTAFLLGRVRGLYAQGLSLPQIGRFYHVSQATLARWKAADKSTTADWRRAREIWAASSPFRFLDRIREVRDELVSRGLKDDGDLGACYKLSCVMGLLRGECGPDREIRVLRLFISWARGHRKGAELALLEKIVRKYIGERLTPVAGAVIEREIFQVPKASKKMGISNGSSRTAESDPESVA